MGILFPNEVMPLVLPAIPAAAKLAAAVLSDKKSRNAVFTAVAAVLAAIFMPIFLIIAILTTPLSGIGDALGTDELDYLGSLQGEYGFVQYLGDADYLSGDGLDYSGISFTDGETTVHYYSQLDSRWKDTAYGDSTIGRSGCGPTALAMAVSSLTDNAIDPVQMSRWAFANGYKAYGNGSYLSLIPEGAVHFGLTVEYADKTQAQAVVDALADGKLVIAIMSKGHFTQSGHFILLRGVTADGKILVADPASTTRSEQEWDLQIIIDEARNTSGASGPFWILS